MLENASRRDVQAMVPVLLPKRPQFDQVRQGRGSACGFMMDEDSVTQRAAYLCCDRRVTIELLCLELNCHLWMSWSFFN